MKRPPPPPPPETCVVCGADAPFIVFRRRYCRSHRAAAEACAAPRAGEGERAQAADLFAAGGVFAPKGRSGPSRPRQ